MTHTPGQWTVHPYAPWSIWSGDTQIASCRWTWDIEDRKVSPFCEQNSDRAEANARLIAAAPDMLRALLEMRPYLKTLLDQQIMTKGEHDLVQAAIDKATNAGE